MFISFLCTSITTHLNNYQKNGFRRHAPYIMNLIAWKIKGFCHYSLNDICTFSIYIQKITLRPYMCVYKKSIRRRRRSRKRETFFLWHFILHIKFLCGYVYIVYQRFHRILRHKINIDKIIVTILAYHAVGIYYTVTNFDVVKLECTAWMKWVQWCYSIARSTDFRKKFTFI